MYPFYNTQASLGQQVIYSHFACEAGIFGKLDLPLGAIDQRKVGQRLLIVLHALVAVGDHLLHHGEVVRPHHLSEESTAFSLLTPARGCDPLEMELAPAHETISDRS